MNVPVTRDEFETVKQLLASAATYSESANRKCDRLADSITRLEASQNQTDEQIKALSESQRKTEESLQELTDSQRKTEEDLNRFIQQTEQSLQQLSESQRKTQEGLQQLSQRLDSFIFESQRLHTDHAQKINRLDAMISRYDGVLAYLMRKDHPEME